MANREFVDRIGMIMCIIIGFMLFVISATAFNDIPNNCTSNIVRDGFTVILVLSVILITSGITYFICTRYNKCYEGGEKTDRSDFYIYMMSGLSLIMTVLSVVVAVEVKGDCANDSLKFKAWLSFGLSFVILLFSGGASYYMDYVIPGQSVIPKEQQQQSTWGGGGYGGRQPLIPYLKPK